MRTSLCEHSISVILNNQHSSGVYVASPSFAPYRYSWFRDGAFIAYAVDLAGEHESARRSHEWATPAVLGHESKISLSLENAQRAIALAGSECFHSRFTLTEWRRKTTGLTTNSMAPAPGSGLKIQHLEMSETSAMPESWQRAVALVREYLMSLWPFPCFDCWEENGDRIHTYTLAASYGGLQGVAGIWDDQRVRKTTEEIRSLGLENVVQEGHLVKPVENQETDVNLPGVATPYGPGVEAPLMRSTVARIQEELRSPGGRLHRYQRDTYCGGGEWTLLIAWLGWYYVETGQLDRAQAIKGWVETQTTPQADLPGQVPLSLNELSYYQVWLERCAHIATPLLWSRAKYLILCQALQARLSDSRQKGL